MVVMLAINVDFNWTTTNMYPIRLIPKHGLFCAFN
jgi:hypothetical protein